MIKNGLIKNAIVSLFLGGILLAQTSCAPSFPRENITQHVELDLDVVPESGSSDEASLICRGAPGFRLLSNYPGYRQYTWHTDLDTYDKIVFDDLKNNATLVAMLAYMASEDPIRVPSTRRTLSSGQRRPACRTLQRSYGN